MNIFLGIFFLVTSFLNIHSHEEIYKSEVPFKSHLFSVTDGQLFLSTKSNYKSNNLISAGRDGKVNKLNFPQNSSLSKDSLKEFCYLGSKFIAVGDQEPDVIYIKIASEIHKFDNIKGSDDKKIKSIVKIISNVPTELLPADVTELQEYTKIFAVAINQSNNIDILVFDTPNQEEFSFKQESAVNTNIKVNENCFTELYWDHNLYVLYGYINSDSGDNLFINGLYNQGQFTINKSEPIALEIQKISGMFTTTNLNYLILTDKNSVYALPLVNNTNCEIIDDKAITCHGMIANKRINPKNIYTERNNFFIRSYQQPGSLSEVLNLKNKEIQVGNSILEGEITHIQVNSDTVFISTNDTYDHERGGIFYSRAVFDSSGTVKGWTNWQRACGSKSALGFAYDAQYNAFWYLPIDPEENTCKKIVKNIWDVSQKKPLEELISKSFENKNGVYFGIDCSEFLAFAGQDKLMLVKSDSLKNIKFEHLNSINNIVIANNAQYNWIVIGDKSGLEILSDNDGQGWDISKGVGSDFENISNMEFKKIHNYKDIKKITVDNDKLYILSKHQLSCLSLDSKSIKSGVFQDTVLVKNNSLKFNDVLVTDRCIILASNKGLYQLIGNNLRKVKLPEYVGRACPIKKIESVCINNLDDNTALDGNIYILNSNLSTDQSQVYRFEFDKNNNLRLLPDQFIKDYKTFFMNLGSYKENFISNGLANFCKSVHRDKHKMAYLEIMPPFIKSGQRVTRYSNQILGFNKKFKEFRGLFQERSSGMLLAYGDFGLLIN